jgi:hypothetical protein
MGGVGDRGVEVLLGSLVGEIRGALGRSLVGVYLYGSLAAGDFDLERSDLDLLAVVSSDVDGEEFDRLDLMHRRFAEEHPDWDDRIEVAYVSAPALRRFKSEMGSFPVISPGEQFHMKESDGGWLMNWYMVQEVGITLFGPPPAAFMPEISKAEFVGAVRENSRIWAEWVHGMRRPGEQSYAILTMCRALYAHTHGEQVSKREAADWAEAHLPGWSSLIRWAWDWRYEAIEDEAEAGADFAETVGFVNDAVERIDRPSSEQDRNLRTGDPAERLPNDR